MHIPITSFVGLSWKNSHFFEENHCILKLEGDVILLLFKIWEFWCVGYTGWIAFRLSINYKFEERDVVSCEDCFGLFASKCCDFKIYTRHTADLFGNLTFEIFITLQIFEEILPCLLQLDNISYGVFLFQLFNLLTWQG
jgi:hypothetical protein